MMDQKHLSTAEKHVIIGSIDDASNQTGKKSRLRRRWESGLCSDKAEPNLIAAILFLPMFFFMILALIDAGMYFTNNSAINNAVRDGATNVSVIAGSGTMNRVTNLERGLFETKTRSELSSTPASWSDRGWGRTSPGNSVEYLLMDTLAQYSNTYRAEMSNVQCAVSASNGRISPWVHSLSDRPFCRVDWRYDGIPFSAFGLFVDSSNVQSTSANVAAEVALGTTNRCESCQSFQRNTSVRR